jgi:geranylgeranyl pyrophosphate synthase
MTQLPLSAALIADLKDVERIVRERTHLRAAVISVAGPHLLRAGEERLRAALVLLSAQVGTYSLERSVHAAAAAELIHAATSTHDDLVDEAARRSGAAARGEWNHGVILMVGDYLFALAAGEMALSPDPRVIGYYAQAVMQICEGALAPVRALRPLESAREQYFAQISGTSAALYAAACRAGAACGGLDSAQIELLGQFGHHLGLALRIGDELRDFTRGSANGSSLAGSSLRHGAATLPLILACASGDGDRLEQALAAGGADLDWAVAEVRRHGLAAAQDALREQAALARAALDGLPDGAARAALAQIVGHAVARGAGLREG